MKKASLVLLLVGFLVTGCGGGEIELQPETDMEKLSTSVAATMYADLQKEPTLTQTPAGISVDDGLLNVDITLPNSLFLDTDMTTFDVDAYANENGFKKAIINEDGSITVTMSKSKHKEILKEYSDEIKQNFNELIGSESTPYIIGITSNSDFTKTIIDVDRAGYELAFDVTPINIGIPSMFYQVLAGIENHCEIIIRDGATKETLKSVIFPDALQ
jgi:hypothetical protein